VRIEYVKSVGSFVDALNDLLASPFPSSFWISDMGDVLVRALRMKFPDANYLDVCQFGFPFGVERLLEFMSSRRLECDESVWTYLNTKSSSLTIRFRL
jgi:hypothetical protein